MAPPAEFVHLLLRQAGPQRAGLAPRDIAGYLSSAAWPAPRPCSAPAQLTGRTALERAAKAGALGAACLSRAALVHDLGRPALVANMLRVFKISSPMSVGSWLLLAGYAPAAAGAARHLD
jgi:hypothetical protein